MTIHKWMEHYNIIEYLDDSDPFSIISMCQKDYAKWKEFAHMKTHGTLLEMTLKKVGERKTS